MDLRHELSAEWSGLMPAGFAFTADSRQTEAGRLYESAVNAENNTRTPLQKAIDNAGYEYGSAGGVLFRALLAL